MFPEEVRERRDAAEGLDKERVLLPLDTWERVWECCQGSAEVVEEELDEEESEWWRRRGQYERQELLAPMCC